MVARIQANVNQKVALYPSIKAYGSVLSSYFDLAVMLAAMTATRARPTDLPICWSSALDARLSCPFAEG